LQFCGYVLPPLVIREAACDNSVYQSAVERGSTNRPRGKTELFFQRIIHCWPAAQDAIEVDEERKLRHVCAA
jgi:hypothetical protein